MPPLDPFLTNLSRLPLLTGQQALRVYFHNNVEAMRRTLARLQSAGWISLSTQLVRERQDANNPIFSLQAGGLQPPASQVAHFARHRWSNVVSPMLIIQGTARLALLNGGEPQAIVAGHLSHEVALVDVILSKQLADPLFEWSMVRAHPGSGVLPDAVSANGYIEVIGQYSTTSISAKLALATNFNLELW